MVKPGRQNRPRCWSICPVPALNETPDAIAFLFLQQCVQVLLRMGADASAYKTDDGGNILHFAVECASLFKGTWEVTKDTSQCLRELLKKTKLLIDQPDDNGMLRM